MSVCISGGLRMFEKPRPPTETTSAVYWLTDIQYFSDCQNQCLFVLFFLIINLIADKLYLKFTPLWLRCSMQSNYYLKT